MEKFLLVALNGLPSGKSNFGGRIGEEFFAGFGNTEILDADVEVRASVEKSGSYVGIDLLLKGSVTVSCDRCLEDLSLPVSRTVLLEVKTGAEASEDQQDGPREVLYLSQDNTELDLSQTVYDYVCLSLPLQRHHEDGGCNPEAIKHLCGFGKDDCSQSSQSSPSSQESANPFAALKGMFDNK